MEQGHSREQEVFLEKVTSEQGAPQAEGAARAKVRRMGTRPESRSERGRWEMRLVRVETAGLGPGSQGLPLFPTLSVLGSR